MKVIATCMARNEADVIEAFVRHNAAFLDAIVVLDHASVDRTPQILRAVAAEGVRLELLHDPDRAFRQDQRQTWLARRYLEALDADFCFALDADEFIRAPSRAALERSLADLPAEACGLVALQNHFAPFGAGDRDAPRRLVRRMRRERRAVRKVVLRRGFARDEAAHVALGNHAAVRVAGGRAQPLPHALVEGIVLSHFPVRNADQVAKKALLGWLSHRLSRPERFSGDPAAPGAPASHWRHLFARLASGEAGVDDSIVREAVAAYAGGDGSPVRDDELVDDPLPVDYVLRYTDAAAEMALSVLARWADGLVSDLNQEGGRAA